MSGSNGSTNGHEGANERALVDEHVRWAGQVTAATPEYGGRVMARAELEAWYGLLRRLYRKAYGKKEKACTPADAATESQPT